MNLDLAGRTVVVTGGSAGVGLELTRHLLAEGARVVTCARDLARLNDVLAMERDAHGDRLCTVKCDVLKARDIDALVAAGRDLAGGARIHGVVCNAGAARDVGFRHATAEDWTVEVDLKLASTMYLLRAALPQLDGGRAVVVSSLVSEEPIPALALSSAARAILLRMTAGLSDVFDAAGVTLSSLLLGPVDSDQWRRRHSKGAADVDYDDWLAEQARDRSIPLGRFGRPEEVAFAATLLLAPVLPVRQCSVLEIAGGLGMAVR